MNEDIKAYARLNKVKLWQIADALGISLFQVFKTSDEYERLKRKTRTYYCCLYI